MSSENNMQPGNALSAITSNDGQICPVEECHTLSCGIGSSDRNSNDASGVNEINNGDIEGYDQGSGCSSADAASDSVVRQINEFLGDQTVVSGSKSDMKEGTVTGVMSCDVDSNRSGVGASKTNSMDSHNVTHSDKDLGPFQKSAEGTQPACQRSHNETGVYKNDDGGDTSDVAISSRVELHMNKSGPDIITSENSTSHSSSDTGDKAGINIGSECGKISEDSSSSKSKTIVSSMELSNDPPLLNHSKDLQNVQGTANESLSKVAVSEDIVYICDNRSENLTGDDSPAVEKMDEDTDMLEIVDDTDVKEISSKITKSCSSVNMDSSEIVDTSIKTDDSVNAKNSDCVADRNTVEVECMELDEDIDNLKVNTITAKKGVELIIDIGSKESNGIIAQVNSKEKLCSDERKRSLDSNHSQTKVSETEVSRKDTTRNCSEDIEIVHNDANDNNTDSNKKDSENFDVTKSSKRKFDGEKDVGGTSNHSEHGVDVKCHQESTMENEVVCIIDGSSDASTKVDSTCDKINASGKQDDSCEIVEGDVTDDSKVSKKSGENLKDDITEVSSCDSFDSKLGSETSQRDEDPLKQTQDGDVAKNSKCDNKAVRGQDPVCNKDTAIKSKHVKEKDISGDAKDGDQSNSVSDVRQAESTNGSNAELTATSKKDKDIDVTCKETIPSDDSFLPKVPSIKIASFSSDPECVLKRSDSVDEKNVDKEENISQVKKQNDSSATEVGDKELNITRVEIIDVADAAVAVSKVSMPVPVEEKPRSVGPKQDTAELNVRERTPRRAAVKAGEEIKRCVSVTERELSPEPRNDERNIYSSDFFQKHVFPIPDSRRKVEQCSICKIMKMCMYSVRLDGGKTEYVCGSKCLPDSWHRYQKFKKESAEYKQGLHHCAQCHNVIHYAALASFWETMEFCSQKCLEHCQELLGSRCVSCGICVVPASLGKYCVRFGSDIQQFCSNICLETFKKKLKVCSYCQKDLNNRGFVAQVIKTNQFKDFCSNECLDKFQRMNSDMPEPQVIGTCAVCGKHNKVKDKIITGDKENQLCSTPCIAAFKWANNLIAEKLKACGICSANFDPKVIDKYKSYSRSTTRYFCSQTCFNVNILLNRDIVPCANCKVKKYDYDMIDMTILDVPNYFCSLHCVEQHKSKIDHRVRCYTCSKFCGRYTPLEYKKRNSYFCSITCKQITLKKESSSMPVISAVQSLASENNRTPESNVKKRTQPVKIKPVPSKPEAVVRPVPEMKNKATSCKPRTCDRAMACRIIDAPHISEGTQTDLDSNGRIVPVPVPIYVPAPMHMFTRPVPVPFPIPLPIPIPVFVPTTKTTIEGVKKYLKEISETTPADPLEAELLLMAQAVADDEGTKEASDNEPVPFDGDLPVETMLDGSGNEAEEEDVNPVEEEEEEEAPVEIVVDEEEIPPPVLDVEAVITPFVRQVVQPPTYRESTSSESESSESSSSGGRKRGRGRPRKKRPKRVKRPRREIREEESDPDDPQPVLNDGKALKHMLGMEAWDHWVHQKNLGLEKANTKSRPLKLFKTDLLLMTPDELNYALCLFVKEVRRPGGEAYAPDTILYLCMGIQEFLIENSRYDNIFMDLYYKKFAECLDEVAQKMNSHLFEVLSDPSSGHIVTRIEEEHLWECNQLGVHSPRVLINTVMYFIVKHFLLKTAEEQARLSFSQIWKRLKSPNRPGSKVPVLKFYPCNELKKSEKDPQLDYEIPENTVNPLRCPIKLFEFYVSKCPDNVRMRTDVLYLAPERSCVPDSPVWYSAGGMSSEDIGLCLHRLTMVREVQEALLNQVV